MTIGERVYITLRSRLTSGYYDAGEQLKELVVSKDLGVSRTPVRAAFSKLISEGLLTPSPTRGAIVTEWRPEDALDIFSIRILLEGHGAALAAKNRTQQQLDVLKRSTDDMEEAFTQRQGDFLAVLDTANRMFHDMLYEASGSAYLRKSGRHLLDFPMVTGFYIYKDDDIRHSIQGHREIIKGIESGNASWARAGLRCHLNAAIERFKKDPESGQHKASEH